VLRRSEAFLAKGQQASLTGTFSLHSARGEFTWSEQLYRIYELQPGAPITFELISTRYHPQDKHVIEDVAEQVRRGVTDFDYAHRLLMPDGSIKYMHVVAHGNPDKEGNGLEYFGAVQDVTQRRLSEEALGKARSELAHVARVTSLGALTASIAHEVVVNAGSVSTASSLPQIRVLAMGEKSFGSPFGRRPLCRGGSLTNISYVRLEVVLMMGSSPACAAVVWLMMSSLWSFDSHWRVDYGHARP